MKRFRGLWIALIGSLLVIGSDLAYGWRAKSENARLSQSGWHLFIEPSDFEEGAFWGSAVAIAFGFGLLIRDLAKTKWSKVQ